MSNDEPANVEMRSLIHRMAVTRNALHAITGTRHDGRTALSRSWPALLDGVMTSLIAGGKLIVFGNGGSAAMAQHLAAELVVRFRDRRRPLPAVALTTDGAVLTACGNDLDFEYVFSRQVEALVSEHDYVLGLTTSGRSHNVMHGLLEAASTVIGRTRVRVGAITGRPLAVAHEHVTQVVVDPAAELDTATIQEVQMVLLHELAARLEEEMYG